MVSFSSECIQYETIFVLGTKTKLHYVLKRKEYKLWMISNINSVSPLFLGVLNQKRGVSNHYVYNRLSFFSIDLLTYEVLSSSWGAFFFNFLYTWTEWPEWLPGKWTQTKVFLCSKLSFIEVHGKHIKTKLCSKRANFKIPQT